MKKRSDNKKGYRRQLSEKELNQISAGWCDPDGGDYIMGYGFADPGGGEYILGYQDPDGGDFIIN